MVDDVVVAYSHRRVSRGGDLQGSSFQPIICVTSYIYVTFHLYLRHVSIQFPEVDLYRRQQVKNLLLR